MATGTQNPAAGEYPLDSTGNMLVSVSPQCVGARRCPLFIFLPGGLQTAAQTTAWLRPVADKYGMILLAPTEYGRSTVDQALKEVLQRFAIDPDKIAIIGRCGSGDSSMALGIHNLHIFSRIASISGNVPIAGMDSQNKTAEFLIDIGLLEDNGKFAVVRALRQGGHPVKHVIGLRGHEHQEEDYDFLGRWLHESWTKPDPATRTAPAVVADPLPLLTTEALTKMTAFWTRFSLEPDSIRTTARRAYLREVVVPVGEERPSLPLVDMAALAAAHPSVAAAFKAAGLTAQQHDAYRVAVISARVGADAGSDAGVIEAASVLAQNIAFMNAHSDELQALETAGVENSEDFGVFAIPSYDPDQAKALGAMGMWRTP